MSNSLEFDSRVGPRIKASRERLGITQAELARRVNVRPETIRDWEGCYGYPSVSFQRTMADALGCTVPWLLDGVGDPPGDPRPVLPHLEESGPAKSEQPVLAEAPAIEQPAPDPAPAKEPTWQELMAERQALDAHKKAAAELADARLKEIDALLWPLFTDEQPRLEIEGYTLTRVAPEPRTVVTWDVDKALQSPQSAVLRAMLTPYRQEAVKTTKPYLKGTTGKGAGKP